MNIKKWYISLLILGIISLFIGAIFKVFDWTFSGILISIGLCILVIFCVLLVVLIIKNPTLSFWGKVLWIIGFILTGYVASVLYYAIEMDEKIKRDNCQQADNSTY